jgi:chemotaxis protein MotB
VLRQVAGVLGKEELSIEVEGHTDNIPIATVQFPSNWELSSARASSVARLLGEGGVPARRLAVIGRGANQPLASNVSVEGRGKNRRVTIIVVSPGTEADAEKAGQSG